MIPALFVGHGSPENAIEDNEFSRNWKKLAHSIPRPESILCVSAHWELERTAVTAMDRPRTIHDFYGFQKELYEKEYNAPGSPELAKEIKQLIKTTDVALNHEWGLDHGTWSVLANMYPEADIQVVQLSIDDSLRPKELYQIGKEVSPLREKGVMIIASGNLVHNLMRMDPSTGPYDWAIEFDAFVKKNMETRDDGSLIDFSKQRTASYAHPSDEHYLPLLYVLGASEKELPQFFNEGIYAGSIGMRCAVYGAKKINF